MTTPIDSVHAGSSAPIKATAPKTAMKGAGFSDALQAASRTQSQPHVVIQKGDTLISLIREQAGPNISQQRVMDLVRQVANDNGLHNPNRILAGSTLDLSSVQLGGKSTAATSRVLANPVLSETLNRAVDKGFVKAHERHSVEQRIESMGKRYGFAPDDFARMVLMESDGLNPKASNGRCHGIIQFCEGAARGADSVGLRGRAHEIARMSVPQQLNLVERYFNDVGLKPMDAQAASQKSPGLGLDDLYLSVLTPSARQEPRPHVPLNIAGDQARALYVGADRDKGITRQSLTQGLHQHAQRVLSNHEQANAGNAAATQRQHLAARNSYVDVAVLSGSAAKTRLSRP